MSARLGPEPCNNVTCPGCNRVVTTHIELTATTKTHVVALLMCLTACWPCACALYFTPCLRAKNHYCPNCNAYIGTYDR